MNEITLSVHAIEGRQGAEMIRMLGKYKKGELLILVNSGSTHSFLHAKVAKELKIPFGKCTSICCYYCWWKEDFQHEHVPCF